LNPTGRQLVAVTKEYREICPEHFVFGENDELGRERGRKERKKISNGLGEEK
jgi:hypothetical protein